MAVYKEDRIKRQDNAKVGLTEPFKIFYVKNIVVTV